MQWYEIKLKVHTALGTRLSADTLFGHLCWALRCHQGESALTGFLKAYADGNPPLIFSDPFPDGFWPLPVLPRPNSKQQKELEKKIQEQSPADLDKRFNSTSGSGEKSKKSQYRQCSIIKRMLDEKHDKPSFTDAFDLLKWLSELNWLPDEALAAVINRVSTADIWNYFIQNGCGRPKLPQETISAHNTINRLTGTTGDRGSFFFTRRLDIDPSEPPVFRMLAASGQFSSREIQDLLCKALEAGYGKYKSRGCGKVGVESIEPAALPKAVKPNAVLLLASCVPAADDPTTGFWKLNTKFGKLGGDWAVGAHPSGRHNVHKKPLTMLTAGTVLKIAAPKSYYGQIVEKAHPDFEEICHYAIAPALPIHLAEDL